MCGERPECLVTSVLVTTLPQPTVSHSNAIRHSKRYPLCFSVPISVPISVQHCDRVTKLNCHNFHDATSIPHAHKQHVTFRHSNFLRLHLCNCFHICIKVCFRFADAHSILFNFAERQLHCVHDTHCLCLSATSENSIPICICRANRTHGEPF